MAKNQSDDEILSNRFEFELTDGLDTEAIEKSLSDEGTRLGTLESIVNGFMASRISMAEGKPNVDMSSKEISDIAAASERIMSMRRRHNGFSE